jgi:muramoyltetrapeptide carboxypeptidase
MLLQLHHAGILNRQQAIVLGSFSGAAANDYDAGYDLLTMIDYIRSRIRVPSIKDTNPQISLPAIVYGRGSVI